MYATTLYKISGIGETAAMEGRLVVARACGKGGLKVTNNECKGFFWG